MYLQRARSSGGGGGGVPLSVELPHHEYKVVAPSNQSKSPDWAAGENIAAHCTLLSKQGRRRREKTFTEKEGTRTTRVTPPPLLPSPPLSIYLNFGGLCRGPAGPSFTPRVLLVHTQKNSTLDEERPAEAASNRPSPRGVGRHMRTKRVKKIIPKQQDKFSPVEARSSEKHSRT